MKALNRHINYILFALMIIIFCIFMCKRLIPQYSVFVISATMLISIATAAKSLLSYNNLQSHLQKKYYFVFISITIYMSLMGLVTQLLYERSEYSYYLLDVATMFIVLGAVNFCTRDFDSEKFVRQMLIFCGIIGFLCGIVSIIKADWSLTAKRTVNIYDIQYVFWNMLSVWPYLIFWTLLNGKKKSLLEYFLTIACTCEYLILGLLFQKRVILFEIIGIIAVTVYCNRKKLKKLAKIVLVVLLLTALAVSFVVNTMNLDLTPMIDNVIDRYADTDIASYDRLLEFVELFDQYNPVSVVLGLGFGSVQNGPGHGNLHIGWLNYIFKGGVFLLLINILLVIKALRLMKNSTHGFSLFISASCVYNAFITFTLSSWFPSEMMAIISCFQFIMLGLYDKRFGNSQWQLMMNDIRKKRRTLE